MMRCGNTGRLAHEKEGAREFEGSYIGIVAEDREVFGSISSVSLHKTADCILMIKPTRCTNFSNLFLE